MTKHPPGFFLNMPLRTEHCGRQFQRKLDAATPEEAREAAEDTGREMFAHATYESSASFTCTLYQVGRDGGLVHSEPFTLEDAMARMLRYEGKLIIDLSQRPALAQYRERAPIWHASARAWYTGDCVYGEGLTEDAALAALATSLGYPTVADLMADAHLHRI